MDANRAPDSRSLLSAMVEGFNADDTLPTDARLVRAWHASWPFTYNTVVIDVAAASQLPILLQHMMELPEVKHHDPSVIKYKTPSDEDLNRLQYWCGVNGVPPPSPDTLSRIIAIAVKIGIVTLPRE